MRPSETALERASRCLALWQSTREIRHLRHALAMVLRGIVNDPRDCRRLIAFAEATLRIEEQRELLSAPNSRFYLPPAKPPRGRPRKRDPRA